MGEPDTIVLVYLRRIDEKLDRVESRRDRIERRLDLAETAH